MLGRRGGRRLLRRGTSGLNLLLAIDKPAGMSSHDVVDAVRRALGERRVGHAGTLDPAATGVLVVGVGQGTRLMGLLSSDTKSYVASIRFGAETSTDDAEGEVTATAAVPDELRGQDAARELLSSFLGTQLQVPPQYSAISVGGRRSYARARAGESFELEPREVRVSAAELIGIDEREGDLCWQCAFTVSKGTYVRALARDLGRRAGSAAHLDMLCRTASGAVTLAQCVSLERLAELGAQGVEGVSLDPVRALALPRMDVLGRTEERVRNGLPLSKVPPELGNDGRVAITSGTSLIGVWQARGGRLRPVANFPQGIGGVRA